MSKKRVILDTNFLLIPGQFLIDIFTQIEDLLMADFELCVMDGTLKELEVLAAKKTKSAKAARLGVMLVKQKPLKTISSSKAHVDDEIVASVKIGEFVATQDKELKKRVKEKGAKVITMRGKDHLIIEE